MARYASFLTFTALVLDDTAAFTQQKPNFSGRWVSTSNPNRHLTAAQDDTRLVITDEGTLTSTDTHLSA
jgi:hypothetical protein